MSDDKTPTRTPSAMRMSLWGSVAAWFAQDLEERCVVLTLTSDGRYQVAVHDGSHVEVERAMADEDPSGAVARAIGRLSHRG